MKAIVLFFFNLNTHDVTSTYNRTSNRIWLKKRLTQSTSLKIKWPEKNFWAPNLGAHTGKPASKNPWIRLCIYSSINAIVATDIVSDNTKRPKSKENKKNQILKIYAFCQKNSAEGLGPLSMRIHPKSCRIFPIKVETTLRDGSRKGAIGA